MNLAKRLKLNRELLKLKSAEFCLKGEEVNRGYSSIRI